MSTLDRKLSRRRILGGRWRREQRKVIRPPGAAPADSFDEFCNGCGDCADVCPAQAISMTGPATGDSQRSPEIVVRDAPCVMCDGLLCASACPTGALVETSPAEMKIALIHFNADACWASQGIDPGCDYCFDRCPLKGEAVTWTRDRGPSFHAGSCTGCGLCVHFCPAQPAPLTAIAAGAE